MHLKNLLFLVFSLLVAFPLAAQQLPLFSVYRDQRQVLNPADLSNNYLLNEMNISLGASYRRQWLGLDESPTTQVLSFEYISPNNNHIVTGGHIINDQTGKLGQLGVYGRCAYRLELSRRIDQVLVFGLGAGLVQYRARLNDISFAEPEDAALVNSNTIFPDFSLGAFYHYKDQYYAGISVPQVFGLRTVFRDSSGQRAFAIKRTPHLYGVVGGFIDVAWFNSSTSFIEPTLWLRYVPNSPISADVNLRYQISDFYWLGLGGGVGLGSRLSTTLHFETGFKLGEAVNIYNGQWTIGFAFDVPLSQYRSLFGNTFEVTLGYAWEG
jgi:type IX secretion system PorP/SprF family membrane protein